MSRSDLEVTKMLAIFIFGVFSVTIACLILYYFREADVVKMIFMMILGGVGWIFYVPLLFKMNDR